jgi:hypothetical protein
MTSAHIGGSYFVGLDLRQARGLEEVVGNGESFVDSLTLRRSGGQIPEAFLAACGLQDWEIAAARLYDPDLSNEQISDIQSEVFRLRAQQTLRIGSLFISYSHHNESFVEAVESRLDARGIRYWRDKHDFKAGRVERQIDRGLRLNSTVLLVLSEHSVESDWVEWEAGEARKLERELGRDVLCPVALDDSWRDCKWSGPLRQQIEDYHILDFSEWEDEKVMDRQFAKLLDGLALFYERGEE